MKAAERLESEVLDSERKEGQQTLIFYVSVTVALTRASPLICGTKNRPSIAIIKLELTLRLLMSYIYIYIYIYIELPFLIFLDHTQRRSTVGRTPLDE